MGDLEDHLAHNNNHMNIFYALDIVNCRSYFMTISYATRACTTTTIMKKVSDDLVIQDFIVGTTHHFTYKIGSPHCMR
ncbi:hypothetical protein J1N35_011181 [Gossypium stocksii]|uniref:Uncharacterized protein n=1 Tax=Gossypium stocksii TaxID=47602 RepID=A0A9D4ACY8_9ROSI|nr:hypothetical protein J1N35_011181 [Gossypium stocksii]